MSDNPLNTIAHARGLGLTIYYFLAEGADIDLRDADGTFVRRVGTWDEAQAFLDGASWQYRRERGE